jgi:selenocysteine-specific elongation factor
MSAPASPSVVATAGHVDHGKSSLILRLTGMDPDRLEEEKRRGLTIELGFAWTTLPSGREVGFVDVPGHERFIRTMLAGVGPTRLMLFVVAADEGWRRQSEEHLQIVDVLGASGAVVALTKRDLVDDDVLSRRRDEVRVRLDGTHLADAPVVSVSSTTGAGVDELIAALDDMVAAAPEPETNGRPRQFVDRVFTVRGAGTVVTGTLTGGTLTVGQEAEVLPAGVRARIRGLQTHQRALEVARPVSRLAVNLAGTARTEMDRGDVLVRPGQWRTTTVFDAAVRTVRGAARPLTARGAFKVHAGAAERDARLRFLADAGAGPAAADVAYARVTLTRPMVLDVGEPFVIRDAGRRETVAGGTVLDVDPPPRPGRGRVEALARRHRATRAVLPTLLLAERGAVPARDVLPLTGAGVDVATRAGAVPAGEWLLDPAWLASLADEVRGRLELFHAEHPLRAGMDAADVRAMVGARRPGQGGGLADAALDHLVSTGVLARDGASIRLPAHHPTTEGRAEADRLVDVVARDEPTPPTVRDLLDQGYPRDLIDAVCGDGRLRRVGPDLVFTPAFLSRAEDLVRTSAGPDGITVSAFREALGTTRKYALPILEYFDATGVTRRMGEVRLVPDRPDEGG